MNRVLSVLGITTGTQAKTTIKIQQIGLRYDVDMGDSRIHVLNENSLRWNLKHWGVSHSYINEAFDILDGSGYVEFELEDVDNEEAA